MASLIWDIVKKTFCKADFNTFIGKEQSFTNDALRCAEWHESHRTGFVRQGYVFKDVEEVLPEVEIALAIKAINERKFNQPATLARVSRPQPPEVAQPRHSSVAVGWYGGETIFYQNIPVNADPPPVYPPLDEDDES